MRDQLENVIPVPIDHEQGIFTIIRLPALPEVRPKTITVHFTSEEVVRFPGVYDQ